jgi:hypothetical protein
MPDNRELALIIWLVPLLWWILSTKDLRTGLRDIAHSLLTPFICSSLLAMFVYMALEVWLGTRLGIWNRDLLKATILWALLAGAVMFFESTRAAREPHFFRNAVTETIAVAAFIDFFMNFFVMSLLAELILQPFLIVLLVLSAVAGHRPEHRQVKSFLDIVRAFTGFVLMGYVLWRFFTEWRALDGFSLALEFLLPVWLTIGLLPFVYVFSLVITYDSALRGINWAAKDGQPRWRAWFALTTGLHIRHREVRTFNWNWATRLIEAPTLGAARSVIRDFRRERRAALQAIADELARERRYAGSNETDAAGRRLDRREFDATIDALRFLESCQNNWHRNRGGVYRDDLLRMIGNDFRGLPKQPGIILKVSDDGQAWYAWRRTISGWCFALGASGPPMEHWEYDGPEPPQDFPGRDPCWGDSQGASATNRNWAET